MICQNCNLILRKFGFNTKGIQRLRCSHCQKIYLAPHKKPFNEMKIPVRKGISVLYSLLEGMSIRSTERITGVHRDTILDLLLIAGSKCERLLEKKIHKVPVKEVQADELWGFVFCKERHKKIKNINSDDIGTFYTFVAIERYSKLVLSWHLGKRSKDDTEIFTEKLERATSGRFQITTDGFNAYKDAVVYSLGTRVDFAQLNKSFHPSYKSQSPQGERRYSPPSLLRIGKIKVIGRPFEDKICTSHIERYNLTIRMSVRRLTRLTNAFSKKKENLRAALALYFAYYNFCRIHSSIRCTPAMEAGITNHVWKIEELLC